MADGQEDDDKQHEPTQKKLDDARKKGEVPRSADLTTAAAYGGFLIVAMSVGSQALQDVGTLLSGLLLHAGTLSLFLFDGSGLTFLGSVMADVGWSMVPWFLVPAVLALLSTIAQRSFVIAPEKLKPKLSRINPIANAKNKFGRSGLFEFAKSFTKLLVYSLVLGIFLAKQLPEILGTLMLTPALATVVLLELVARFFSLVLAIALVIGGIDFFWQREEHLRKNRMSHKELMDEAKQNEGDPQMKQKRRQKGYEIAMNRMLADVPTADVVVVNPTHYAVALKWSRLPGEAPVCVAKGVDEMAARIREAASEAGVPIHRDPATARAIHATVEIGQEVKSDHYKAVAVAIRFAEKMRSKMRDRISERREKTEARK